MRGGRPRLPRHPARVKSPARIFLRLRLSDVSGIMQLTKHSASTKIRRDRPERFAVKLRHEKGSAATLGLAPIHGQGTGGFDAPNPGHHTTPHPPPLTPLPT